MIFFLSPAELSRRLEERDSLIGQLQRSKAAITQNHEDLKKQQEEATRVSTGLKDEQIASFRRFQQVCVVSVSRRPGSRSAGVTPRLQSAERTAGGRAGGQGRTAEGTVQYQHSGGSVENQI